MLIDSSNEAANSLEVLIGGSTSGGGARIDALLRSLGLADTEMYGGYLRGTYGRAPIPRRVDSQPWLGRGKYTTAFDLARLLTLVHLAAEGRGPLAERYRGQFTPSDARFLLYLLAHVPDRGKLGRFLPPGAVLMHKAGWISGARHDAGLVYWGGGVFVVSVMTYGAGVGVGSDVLAGRIARVALSSYSSAGEDKPRSRISSTTAGSASVVVSPRGRFSATSRSSRRMILPERVFGSSGVNTILAGLAIGPMTCATWSRSSPIFSTEPS